MQPSKLEMYVNILRVLCQNGPLELRDIFAKAKIKCETPRKCLNFLLSQGLAEKRVVENKKVVYTNTPKSTAVVKFFKEPTKPLHITTTRHS